MLWTHATLIRQLIYFKIAAYSFHVHSDWAINASAAFHVCKCDAALAGEWETVAWNMPRFRVNEVQDYLSVRVI